MCRRLVDAGRARGPGPHRGRAPLRRAHHLRRPRLRAGVDVAVGRAPPDPAHPPRPDRRPRARRARPPPGCSASTPAGISDDLLTNVLLATRAPVLVCPAMHTEMWEHPAVQDNLRLLRSRGVHVVEPESGRLAGGDVGAGRLAEPETIVAAVDGLLADRARSRPHRAARRRHRRRHPRADRPGALHRQPLVGQAGPRRRRGGRRAAAPRSPSSPPPACPASAGIDVVPRRHGRRDGARRPEPGRPRRRRRDGRRGRRLPARRRRPTPRSRRPDGVPAGGARADQRHPRRPRRPAAARPDDRRLRGRDRRPARQRRRQARPQGDRPHRGQRRVGPRRGLRARHQRRGDPRRRRRGRRRSPSPTSGPSPAPSSTQSRPQGATRDPPVDLHLGVRDRRPSRQDGRPDLGLDPRRHPRRGPDGPRRVRDDGHHRPRHRRRRDHHQRLRRDPADRPRDDQGHRLRPRVGRLRRQHLRRDHLDRPAVARHRPGRRHRARDPHRRVRRGPPQQPGRRRPGDDVRLRRQRDPRPHAAADLARPPPGRAARRGPQVRRAPVPPPRRQDPGHRRLRGQHARSGSPPCSSPRSTSRASTPRR